MGALIKNGINYSSGSGASSYNELNDKPSIENVTLSGNKSASDLGLAKDSDLANVAKTGSYNDLKNKPAIPSDLDDMSDVELTTPTDGQVLKYNSTSGKWENGTGGGGGGSYTAGDGISIENDEISIDPMPAEDVDEVIDIYPTAGNLVSIVNAFNRGDIYSTTERMIGQWTNGKPLYQCVALEPVIESDMSGKLSSSSTDKRQYWTKTYSESCVERFELSILTNTSNNEGYVSIELNGTELTRTELVTSTATKIMPYSVIVNIGDVLTVYAGFNNSHSGCWFEFTGIRNTLQTAQPLLDIETIMLCDYNVLRYTKTTDTAISIGEATEYSTEEKIVGTWIDGKPLYQCTFNLTNPRTDWTANSLGITADKVFLVNTCYQVGGNTPWMGGNSFYSTSSNMFSVFAYKDSSTNEVSIWIRGAGGTITDLYVTLQYTKTT